MIGKTVGVLMIKQASGSLARNSSCGANTLSLDSSFLVLMYGAGRHPAHQDPIV